MLIQRNWLLGFYLQERRRLICLKKNVSKVLISRKISFEFLKLLISSRIKIRNSKKISNRYFLLKLAPKLIFIETYESFDSLIFFNNFNLLSTSDVHLCLCYIASDGKLRYASVLMLVVNLPISVYQFLLFFFLRWP